MVRSRYCSVKNCFNTEKDHTFFSFPDKYVRLGNTRKIVGVHPHKTKVFDKWVKFCGDISIKNYKSANKKVPNFVCDIHFESEAFQNPSARHQLLWYAVPTLHGPVFDSNSQCLLQPDLSEGTFNRNGRIIRLDRFLRKAQLEKENSLSLTCRSEVEDNHVPNGPEEKDESICEIECLSPVVSLTETNTKVDFDCDIDFGSTKHELQISKQQENISGFSNTLKQKEICSSDTPRTSKKSNSIADKLSEFIVIDDTGSSSRLSDSYCQDYESALVSDHSYTVPQYDESDSNLQVNPCKLPSDSSYRNLDQNSLQDITSVPNRRNDKNSAVPGKQNVFTKDILFCGECQRMFNSFETFVVHKLMEEQYKMTFEPAHLVKGLWIPKLYKKSELDLQAESEKSDAACTTSPKPVENNETFNRSNHLKAKYPCSKCDKSFAIKAPLIKHYFKMHAK